MKPNKLIRESVQLITPRIGDEYKAMYFYRSAANWAKDNGFFKAAEYFDHESKEELEHSEGLQKYLVDWNVLPDLPVIAKPETFSSLMEIIEKAYQLEYDLYEAYEDTSMKIFDIPDPCSFDFLQKYRGIQTESVAKYADMLNMLEGVEPTKINLLLIEDKLFA
jgi:ferritin